MNIKASLRKLLFESKESRIHNYGCVMVFLKYNKDKWKELQKIINKDDLYTKEDDSSYGLEDEPHVTLLYGLHEEVKDSDIKERVDKISKISMDFKKISTFNNDDFSVLKFDVTSKDLNKYNKTFAELPHTNSYDYHPHATIAYIKPDTKDEYLKDLNDFIKNNDLGFEVDKIVYSKTDGSKINYNL